MPDTYKPADGSCWWNHKWSQWEQYNVPVRGTLLGGGGQIIEGIEMHQRRTCLRCGYMQNKKVDRF